MVIGTQTTAADKLIIDSDEYTHRRITAKENVIRGSCQNWRVDGKNTSELYRK